MKLGLRSLGTHRRVELLFCSLDLRGPRLENAENVSPFDGIEAVSPIMVGYTDQGQAAWLKSQPSFFLSV